MTTNVGVNLTSQQIIIKMNWVKTSALSASPSIGIEILDLQSIGITIENLQSIGIANCSLQLIGIGVPNSSNLPKLYCNMIAKISQSQSLQSK